MGIIGKRKIFYYFKRKYYKMGRVIRAQRKGRK